jgi:hypothetical protein
VIGEPAATGRSLLAVACALALLTACAARRPAARALSEGDPRPAQLGAALEREAAARRSLRGVAKVALDGPGGSGRAKQVLALERPARLRVEVLGLLDQTIALLVSDGARYRLVRSDRSAETGPVHDALLADVAGLAVTPAAAVGVLLAAPLAAGARVVGGAALADGGVQALVANGGRLERERLDFDAAGNLRAWTLLAVDGEPLLEARYADLRPLAGAVFPYDVELIDHASGASARIAWSRVELDPVLSPSLFALPGEARP